MERVLVVDDAELNRELLCSMLSDTYLVDMAADGLEALDQLTEHRNDTAALLLDLCMPNMDGFAVLDSMRTKGLMKHIPVRVFNTCN